MEEHHQVFRTSPTVSIHSERKLHYEPKLPGDESSMEFENYIEDEGNNLRARSTTSSRHVLWPVAGVCVPMMILCATLLAVVFGYEIRPVTDVFGTSITPDDYRKADYLLVNFSDTKIVFLASFLSTIAPLLAGCVMTIASIRLLAGVRGTSGTDMTVSILSSEQERLLGGLIAVSYRQLLDSFSFIFTKRGKRGHAAVTYAATLLFLTILMSIAVFVSDAVLHMLTHTVSATLYTPPTTPSVEHGRGLNAFCADFNRSTNLGYPCTTALDSSFNNPNLFSDTNEVTNLAHNTSTNMVIRLSGGTGKDRATVAYLTPEATTIETDLGYQAETLGASAKCTLIPATTCNVTRWGADNRLYASFNCSDNFWGSLGLPENATSIASWRRPSRYLPLLSVKPQANLQYSFFSDHSLQNVYNPAGLNDSAQSNPITPPLPDDELPSSVYMAFAWRVARKAFAQGKNNEMCTTDKTSTYTDKAFVDYFMSCEVLAYNVNYVWYNGSAESVVASRIQNGTVVAMWQTTYPYGPTINGEGHMLQELNNQAMVAGTTIAAYEDKFGALLSAQVMANIGGYTSPRTVLKEQRRQDLLLAKIPKGALGSLVACSLLYPVLGMFLLYQAHRSLRHSTVPVKETLTTYTRNYPSRESWNQYRNSLPPQPQLITPPQTSKSTDHGKLGIVGDRNSTAGFRFVLWGDAGVGPNFNHLSSNHHAAGGVSGTI